MKKWKKKWLYPLESNQSKKTRFNANIPRVSLENVAQIFYVTLASTFISFIVLIIEIIIAKARFKRRSWKLKIFSIE